MAGRMVVTAKDGWVAEGGDRPAGTRSRARRNGTGSRWSSPTAAGWRCSTSAASGRILLNPGPERLGPDAVVVTPAEFRALISKGTIAVKARLLDQSKIAGIGNLLADEILWQARISPARPVSQLRRQDIDRLYRALRSVLTSATAEGGGAHTGEVITARRPGGSCPRCGAEMRHGTVGGRSTWWCSREQAA